MPYNCVSKNRIVYNATPALKNTSDSAVQLISLNNITKSFSIFYWPFSSRMSTEHRSKRFRRRPPPTHDNARNCYLDTLADDNLRLVLCYLSDRPKYQNWRAYVSAFSVNTAPDLGGAVTRLAPMEFQNIGSENGIPGEDGIPLHTFLHASILRPRACFESRLDRDNEKRCSRHFCALHATFVASNLW